MGGFYRENKFGVTYARVEPPQRYKTTFMSSTISLGEADSYSPSLLLLRCSGESLKTVRERDALIFRDAEMARNANGIIRREIDMSVNSASAAVR